MIYESTQLLLQSPHLNWKFRIRKISWAPTRGTTEIPNREKTFGQVRSPSELGQLLRSVRKGRQLTLDDVYAATSLSLRFLSELERGKLNASLGKTLLALQSLGLDLVIVPRAHTAAVLKYLADRSSDSGRPEQHGYGCARCAARPPEAS